MRYQRSPIRITWNDFIDWSEEAGWGVLNDFKRLGFFSATFQEQSIQGLFEGHFFGPGLKIVMADVYLERDLEITIPELEPTAGFGLATGGSCVKTFKDSRGRSKEMPLSAGHNIAGSFNAEETSLKFSGGQRHRMVNVRLTRSSVPDLMEDWAIPASEPLSKLLLPCGSSGIALEKPISPGLASIVHQMLGSPYTGTAQRLFMQAKALEILACQVDEFSQSVREKCLPTGRADVERLHQARKIIENEFADPPSLPALARRVGINDSKLKRGFREVFGTTVFAHVRRLRMEKARELLETSDLSVTQVALTVGYSALGHFAGAFKRSFGILPKQYRRARALKGRHPVLKSLSNSKSAGRGN